MGDGHFVTVAKTGEVPPGGMMAVEVDGAQVLVCNVGGEYHAVHDECTHECFPLSEGSLDGHTVTCMLHGASFDVRSGEILSPPAYEPLKTYRVRVDGDDVLVAVEP
jgi:3-phenylpropionate/trans-cinnamate dioxygenase ferredoxin subunit